MVPLRLPRRPPGFHKGQAGHVLVVAGARGMAGAAALCAGGALRAGAGLVTVALPASILNPVAARLPEAMTLPLPETAAGGLAPAAFPRLRTQLPRMTALAVGPGLGQARETGLFLRLLLAEVNLPLVLDADGLNLLARGLASLPDGGAPARILTPHPGEAARLLGSTAARIQEDRVAAARELARRFRAVIALKGAGTVVTDGERVEVNRTGNPGLATGGSGDVLTGVTAGLLAQGLEAFAAARLAVHLHGLAGDLAQADLGERALLAGDLLQYLPAALRKLEREERP